MRGQTGETETPEGGLAAPTATGGMGWESAIAAAAKGRSLQPALLVVTGTEGYACGK